MPFRFEKLEIWQRSADVADKLFDIADGFEAKKRYRFAEQVRGAALSVPNNIAEGSGSTSNPEFKQFLNLARRSVFECANMLLLLESREIVTSTESELLLQELDELSRMITAFSRTLEG